MLFQGKQVLILGGGDGALMNELQKQMVKFREALEGDGEPSQKADVVELIAFKGRSDFY